MPLRFSDLIKKEALSLGFNAVGVTSLPALKKGEEALSAWTKEGRHGGMKYLENFQERKRKFFEDFPGASSVIVLGANYYNQPPREEAKRPEQSANGATGRVARYAWGRDYHEVIGEKHKILMERLKNICGAGFKAKSCVDIQPVTEKFAASRAGLGFIGKNTLLLSRKYGPWLFLSEIVTNLELPEDLPDTADCGTCRSCQDVCPTGALDQDYKIDARLCIAYLTIEHKGVIPRELRPKMKDWVFGCDECLTGCPFNSKAQQSTWPEFSPGSGAGPEMDLTALFEISSNSEYEKKFSGSAVSRANRKQMLRNACIVLGNSGRPEMVPYLEKGLSDQAPLVRLHAAWGLGQIAGLESARVLKERLKIEKDPEVQSEILFALAPGKIRRNQVS